MVGICLISSAVNTFLKKGGKKLHLPTIILRILGTAPFTSLCTFAVSCCLNLLCLHRHGLVVDIVQEGRIISSVQN